MHLLAAAPGAVDDGSEAVDLGQTPGDIIVLTAADTEIRAGDRQPASSRRRSHRPQPASGKLPAPRTQHVR